ncbi:MAG: tetratricopeptide repeat protein [Gammaproteobacteria bacterium]|nr:tetratricopeptide repeat protein [Gammaproteobacteria bacterium]MBT8105750.1 tetratricopeptide repeat protein [Gammaproteobacteria bacterium]NNF49015.1 tetratricopeptide repeat protein [Woeseiaceae bacterium]NNK25764.1 tetratricopeptide repeat protein [Woeseiaceae bacterium]
MKLVSELKRRNVFQTAGLYAVAAWLIMQVGEVIFEPLHFPDWAMTLLVILVILGFPVVVVLAWFFDLTRHGIKKDTSALPQIAEGIAADQARSLRGGPSIAVLSFDDMSPDKDQEYLCDGIAEEILNRLAQIQNLRVASRTSSFRFKGQPADVGNIGRQLNVATVLEGSVRKSDDQLRIATQLVNAADGYHLWSHSYDRKLEHIFEIQGDIATRVAEALQVTLQVAPADECCTTGDVRAYDYYLQGMHYFRRWGLRNVRFSIDMFSKAVEIDPDYARAWAALADSYAMICMYWNATEGNLAGADSASMRALELLPGLAESHVSRGLYHFANRDNREAIAEFETALRLDPDLFEACYFYARVRFQRSELDQAAELFARAERIRPDDFQAPTFLRQIYRAMGREEEAKAAARRALERAEAHLELYPDDTRALNLGCAALIERGDRERAMQWAERSLAIDGDNPDTLYNIACSYALLGESEHALDCLQRANLRGMSIAEWAQNDSDLASLHDDPRFQELMESLKDQESPEH